MRLVAHKNVFSDCTSVILAGGLGTRLNSVVIDRSKVVAEVNGRPFLTYLLDQLLGAGCEKAILCTGHLGESVEKYCGTRYKNLALFYSRETSPLGTAGALRLALPIVKTSSLLVMNGDSFCDASLEDFYFHFVRKKKKAAVLLSEVSDTCRFGKVLLDERDNILAFSEKGLDGGSGWANAGVYLIHRGLIETIPEGKPASLEKQMFPRWIPAGIYGHRVRSPFLDIGTVETYNTADRLFTQKKKDIP